jgi:pilus assembly protein CpaC
MIARALFLAIFSLLVALPTRAEQSPMLNLTIGGGELVTLDQPATTVFVANPQVADVQIAGPQSIFVFGVATGQTSFFALDAEGNPLARREIAVTHDLAGLRRALAARFSGNRIELTSAPNAIIVEGIVASPDVADAIAQTVGGVLGDGERLINRMQIAAPVQVNLRVRVAEVSRNVEERLGFNILSLFNLGDFAFRLATGGVIPAFIPPNSTGILTGSYTRNDFSINAAIDALSEEGLARTLAEPNLTAISGETASFSAGGEFPIPVGQEDGVITIEFKPFGVILDFTPTVIDTNRINLRVRPEVSDITNVGAITINDLEIPALSVRRVETTVEMASGQSLVIGGLLRQSLRDVVEKVPGLGDVPVLGSLFSSTSYQNDETELIVTVTPYIVRATRPTDTRPLLARPAGNNALEALLTARVRGAARGRLHGEAGFVY